MSLGSLHGPNLKLDRAEEHLGKLEELLTTFIRKEKSRIVPDFDPKTSCKFFCLDPRPPPPEWGPMIGDVLYNCRSALDQFANQMAGGKGSDRSTAWPILQTSDNFICTGKPLIKRMPEEARAFVERYQPYNRTNQPENDLLGLLNGLGNEDKHRQLHVTVTSFEGGAYWGDDIDIVGGHIGPVKAETPLLIVRVAGPEVDVPFNFTLDIAFANRRRWNMPLRVGGYLSDTIEDIRGVFQQAVSEGLISV